MSLHHIILPETKPETEWVRGRALQKMSSTSFHAFLQGALTIALSSWAEGKGKVAPEWRFCVTPPGAIARPLVPDIAYVRNERLRALSDADFQVPPFAPDVAFEVLSPSESWADLDDKSAVYLAAGTALFVLVEPLQRTVTLLDHAGKRVLREGEALEHPALEGFSLPLTSLFAVLARPV